MSHLDEGMLHALLDGELEIGEVRQVQAHLGSCAACDTRLKEVRELLVEADRLVGTLEPPAAAPIRGPEPAAPAPHWSAGPAIDAPPVLLLPDDDDGPRRRGRWLRGLGVAAMLALAVGGGYLISGLRRESPGEQLAYQDEAPSVAARSGSEVVSPIEATPTPAAPTPPRQDAPRAAAEPDRAAADLPNEAAATPPARATRSAPTPQRDTRDDLAARRALAAKATRDLEEELRVARARAATAALDSVRRVREAESRAAAQRVAARAADSTPAPPPVRTPEQRAGVYLRIGLDEAVRQLGGPAHVIEGMSPQFIGLAHGRQVAGADSTRPVVRVVYQDPAGRMILLDQQRLQPGRTVRPGGAGARWSAGDVMLYLHGDLGSEALTNLQRRVR